MRQSFLQYEAKVSCLKGLVKPPSLQVYFLHHAHVRRRHLAGTQRELQVRRDIQASLRFCYCDVRDCLEKLR